MMSKFDSDSLFGADEQDVRPCGHTIRVVFESGVDRGFDYLVPDELWPIRIGQRVETPFGKTNKHVEGYCVGVDVEFKNAGQKIKLKRIVKAVDDEALIDTNLMALAKWISDYYVCPLGQALAAMLPAAVKKGIGVSTHKSVYLAASDADATQTLEHISGRKQKHLVKLLQEKKAFDANSAVELDELLEEADCTKLPLKHLLRNGVAKIFERTVMKALPSIPQAAVAEPKEIILNDQQQTALEHITGAIEKGEFGVTLLYGVTDSGKTELYIRAIETVIKKGNSAIVLLPEIALTAQTVQRFNWRFERVAVLHSGLTGPQRNAQWQKIRRGEADVVIGARSAVFAPLPNLGLIIVDEEHEPSYKQDTAPRYHARDTAVKRSQLQNVHCILGSATPSLETLHNCENKKHFHLIKLTKRVMDLPMPQMRVVDMKLVDQSDRVTLISPQLRDELGKVLERKEQAILLLNRRGYSNFVFCPGCKHTLQCRNCDVTLTFHKAQLSAKAGRQTVLGKHLNYGCAVCHYCLSQTLVPELCPLCGKKMVMFGLGSQRLEEETAIKFPAAKIARVDSDSMQAKDYYHVLRDFGLGKIDILAGTQMLAKGLHFPNVTLVGIISADTSLYLPDFRANERTFQLISQVAGRAGRSSKKGVVYVQSFMPEQPAIQFALRHDFEGFVKEELKHRKICNLPPLWRLATIVLKDHKFDRLTEASDTLKDTIDAIIARDGLAVEVRGPMPCTISRIERFHRMQIILQAAAALPIQNLCGALRTSGALSQKVKTAVDIDPMNLL
jgi:primosomal protein N' (replication factor Y)